MLKPKLPKQEQGFTLVEVLVAILITTLFVSVAMQSMVIAAIFKARAQEFSEATTWIQEDLENIKYQAANFQYTSLSANAASGALLINVTSVDDLAPTNSLKVGSDSGNYTIANGGIIGNALTIAPGLGTAQLQGAVVVGTTRCNASSIDTGFADGLRDKIIGSNQTGATKLNNIIKTSNRTGQAFTLERTTIISSASYNAYNVLQVSYNVLSNSGNTVAKFYTEVIPNAAFQCP